MKKLSLVIISDTHNKHKHLSKLPEADVIIHCGDMTSMGYDHEIANFMKWFSKLEQYKHKICIAGNHDWLFEKNNILAKELIPDNVIYLEDREVVLEGVKFYGTPVQLPFNNWAFNKPEERLIPHWKAIPDDIDVLITHQPPHSIFDWSVYDNIHTGSPSLYWEVLERIKPKIHCFGHIHSGHGIKVIENTTFVNASNLDEDYMCVNKPILLELVDGIVKIIDY
jgi:Icc-related predicted phosphoesterase